MPCLIGAKSGVWTKYMFDNSGNAAHTLHKHETSQSICIVIWFIQIEKIYVPLKML